MSGLGGHIEMNRWAILILAAGAAAAFLIVAAGVAQAQTPPPEPTPCCPSACTGLMGATPGGPAAPSNLTALWGPLPDVPEASGVLLAWQDNAVDETCQVVQRKGPGDVEWQDVIYASPAAESTDDRGFEATGEYCYRVFAANEHGASVSNETCVYVPEVTVHGLPPGAPPPSYPTLPPGVSPPTEVPVATATLPPGAGPSPAAPPASGGGPGPAVGPNLSPLVAGVIAAAFRAAGAATWRILGARRRR